MLMADFKEKSIIFEEWAEKNDSNFTQKTISVLAFFMCNPVIA